MSATKSSLARVCSTLAIAGCLVGAMPTATFAESNPGLTIFSGVKGEFQLNHHLDFGGKARGWDRYRLRIAQKKMKLAVAEFAISYPDYYKGEFDTKRVELRVNGKKTAIQEVKWNKENYAIRVIPAVPVPAGKKVEIWLENVRNPDFGGTFYFECRVLSPGDRTELLRYLGTWIILIS